MALPSELLAVLACPEDKGPMIYIPAEDCLYNPRLRRLYRIDGGIPVLLIEEGTAVEESEHGRIVALAGTITTGS